MLDYSVSRLYISHGSTSAFSAPLNSATVSFDKNVWGVTLTWNPFYPDWEVEITPLGK